jgi:hypothetical protein
VPVAPRRAADAPRPGDAKRRRKKSEPIEAGGDRGGPESLPRSRSEREFISREREDRPPDWNGWDGHDPDDEPDRDEDD